MLRYCKKIRWIKSLYYSPYLQVILLISSFSWLSRAQAQAPQLILSQPAVSIRCGNPHLKKVALTFDDGPSQPYTKQILAILRQHQVAATFFILGRAASHAPNLTRQIAAEGHLLANHSWDHPRHASLAEWRWQLQHTAEIIHSIGNLNLSSYFRPPHGTITPAIRQACSEQGYFIVLYTLLSSDWQGAQAADLTRQVVAGLNPGGIVVLHDGGGQRVQTVQALPDIIRGLRKRGLSLVRLDDLLGSTPQSWPCKLPR